MLQEDNFSLWQGEPISLQRPLCYTIPFVEHVYTMGLFTGPCTIFFLVKVPFLVMCRALRLRKPQKTKGAPATRLRFGRRNANQFPTETKPYNTLLPVGQRDSRSAAYTGGRFNIPPVCFRVGWCYKTHFWVEKLVSFLSSGQTDQFPLIP